MKFKILLFTVFSTLSLTLGNPTSTEPPFYDDENNSTAPDTMGDESVTPPLNDDNKGWVLHDDDDGSTQPPGDGSMSVEPINPIYVLNNMQHQEELYDDYNARAAVPNHRPSGVSQRGAGRHRNYQTLPYPIAQPLSARHPNYQTLPYPIPQPLSGRRPNYQTLPYPIPQPKPTRRPNYKIELIRAWLIQVLVNVKRNIAEILVTLAHFPGKANALMRKIPAWNPFDSKSSIVDKPSVEDMMKRPQYMLLDESETSEVEQVLFDEPEKALFQKQVFENIKNHIKVNFIRLLHFIQRFPHKIKEIQIKIASWNPFVKKSNILEKLNFGFNNAMQNAESDNSTKNVYDDENIENNNSTDNISDDEPENLQRPINNEKDKDVQKQLLNMMEKEGRLSGEEMSKLRNVVLKDWAPGTEVKVVRANPKESEVISDESENNSNISKHILALKLVNRMLETDSVSNPGERDLLIRAQERLENLINEEMQKSKGGRPAVPLHPGLIQHDESGDYGLYNIDAENIIGNIHNNLGLEEVHANVANQLEDAFRKQREHEAKKAQQNDANPEVLNPTPGENVQNSQPNQRNPEILDPSPPDETEKNFQEMLNSDVENEILLKPKIEEVMSDEPERVTTPAPDNSTSVSDNSTTVASDNSTAVASDNSTIATSDNSTTIAPEKQISLAEIYGQFVEELHKQISIVPKKNAGSNVGEGIDLIEKILFKYQDDMKRPEGVPKEEEGQIMKEIERIKEKYQLDVFDKGSQ